MAASDNLSQTLFHGTAAQLKPGDTVRPGRDFSHAFATTDATLAKEYGSNVYKVSPVDNKEASEYTKAELAKWQSEPSADAKSVVKSAKGFKVLGK
jgi:hypothetical protein